jgi:MFS family permease
MASAAGLSKGQEWRQYWPLAMACLSGMVISAIAVYLIGPLIEPMQAELGWSRAQITFGITVSTLLGALLAPFVGVMLDRWGPRRIGLPGAALALVTLALIGLSPSNYYLYLLLWFLITFGALGVMPSVWTTAIASSFEKSRGLAMAVALCGSSVAAVIMPILSTLLIDSYGWRAAVPMICGIIGLVVLPILFFGLRSQADNALAAKPADKPVSAKSAGGGASVHAAIRSPQFFKLFGAAFIFTLCALGFVSNLVPLMTELQFTRPQAAAIAGSLGLASFTGRMATGWLLDRYEPNLVSGALVLLPVISCVMLLNAEGNVLMATAAVLIFGLAFGAEVDVVAFMAAEKFGTARYGTIFGFITSGWYLATAAGPVLMSLTHDLTGAYDLAIKIAIPAFVVTSLLLFTIGKPLPFDEQPTLAA